MLHHDAVVLGCQNLLDKACIRCYQAKMSPYVIPSILQPCQDPASTAPRACLSHHSCQLSTDPVRSPLSLENHTITHDSFSLSRTSFFLKSHHPPIFDLQNHTYHLHTIDKQVRYLFCSQREDLTGIATINHVIRRSSSQRPKAIP